MPSAQWMTLGCYGKIMVDHAVKPHETVLVLNPSCHDPSPTMSLPGFLRLFLCQGPCLNTLILLAACLQILTWAIPDLFVAGLSLICHILPLLFPWPSSHTHSLAIFLTSPIYLPRSPPSKIWVSVLDPWSSRFLWEAKDTYLICCSLSAPSSSLPVPPNKRYLSISNQSF